MWKNANEVKI
jgi:hypothetical protein